MFTYFVAMKNITIVYIFPLPHMDDLMDFSSGKNYFSKLNLKSGYNHIMRTNHVPKIDMRKFDGKDPEIWIL